MDITTCCCETDKIEKEHKDLIEQIFSEQDDFKALDYISHAALFENLAEECSELSHAALKMARILRNENPTPVTIEEAEKNFIEETVDVDICLEHLQTISLTMPIKEAQNLYILLYHEKATRWEERLKTKISTKE